MSQTPAPLIVIVRRRGTSEPFAAFASDVTPDCEYVIDEERLAVIRAADAAYDPAVAFTWRGDERRFLLRLLDEARRA
jgi:hypothetical protein